MTAIKKVLLGFSPIEKKLLGFYSVILLSLFLYSFVQIDLGLVISRFAALYQIEKAFQYVGYFNRELSTYLYSLILLLLFVSYTFFLWMAHKKEISKKFVWTTIIVTTIILTFAYSAFSHDLFNYIFDAKIVTHYHQNPYEHKALDYPGDPMLGFMQWTHRVYPYGPVWLGMTIPLSYLGFGMFLPTFFLFKVLAALSFLGSVFFIGKILQKIFPDRELPGLVFFALNPLVLIESLVSAHLDIVMIFFCVWAFYLLIQKRYFVSLLVLIISIGIKFVTAFLLPVFLYILVFQLRKKKIHWNIVFAVSVGLMLVAAVIATNRANFQPWYLLEAMVFAVFLGVRYFVLIPFLLISLFAMFTYIPYFYTGNWDKPIPQILSIVYLTSYIISAVLIASYSAFTDKNLKILQFRLFGRRKIAASHFNSLAQTDKSSSKK